MATGILGSVDLQATTNTVAYTVPANTFAVVSTNICNRAASARNVRVALTADETTLGSNLGNYIEYDAELLANGVLERAGLVLNAGTKVVVYSNSTDCSVMVYGIETSTV